jgi:hypothetical protein
MTPQLHSVEELLNAAEAAPQPISVLFGSPLSWDANGGVPGVSGIIEIIREEIRAHPKVNGASFDRKVANLSGPDAYQAAMSWVQANLTQDAVNTVIRKAVLRARSPSAPTSFEGDGDSAHWHLPAGMQHLAELLTRDPARFLGPVLTTNFDPLLEVAVVGAGGRSRIHVLDQDGRLPYAVERERGVTDIVHLHGYWRESDTLHTVSQLNAPRPRLSESLKRLLRERTLLVVAYAGWDDVLTNALVEVMNDAEAKINVLWCFRENNPHLVAGEYSHLLQRMSGAIGRGRFLLYGGIDCHAVFEAMLRTRQASGEPDVKRVKAPPGWEWLDEAALKTLPPLGAEELRRFFDGANPSLRHGRSQHIAIREAAQKVSARLSERTGRDGFLQRIASAAGEGKSTVFHQAITNESVLAAYSVLYRREEGFPLSIEFIKQLDSSLRVLIAADNAADLGESAKQCFAYLNASGGANVGFVLSARDTDWIRAGYAQLGIDQVVEELPVVRLRGISDADAESIVKAWAAAGPGGLGDLERISPDIRVTRLRNFVRDAGAVAGEGSFVGGLLQVRFSEAGLRAHLRELLARVSGIPISGSSATLGDALVYAACCHGVGIAGINELVLATLLNVARDFVQTRVVRPLGDEVGATRSRGHVFTRHRAVAAALLIEADQLGIDLGEYWANIVRETASAGRAGVAGDTHGDIILAGPRLIDALPSAISQSRREEIAISAAKSAVRYQSDWLGCVVNLGQTFRKARSPAEGVAVFKEHLPNIRNSVDYSRVIRGYFHEWAVCEANVAKGADHMRASVFLEGLSLSDFFSDAEITDDRVKMSLAGIGVAFGELAQGKQGTEYLRGKRSAAWIGQRSNPDSVARGYFAKYDKECDAAGCPIPEGPAQALEWLERGVLLAAAGVTKDLTELVGKPKLSFAKLNKRIAKSAPRGPSGANEERQAPRKG